MTETVLQQQAEAAESIVRVEAAEKPPRPEASRPAAGRRLFSREGLLAFGFLSPTLLVFSGGEMVEQMVGAQSESALHDAVSEHVA